MTRLSKMRNLYVFFVTLYATISIFAPVGEFGKNVAIIVMWLSLLVFSMGGDKK